MSRLLASELLKKLPEVPAALRELVTGGAEGNPFYMEELVKMLIDQGAIETGEAWKVNAERLLLTQVPTDADRRAAGPARRPAGARAADAAASQRHRPGVLGPGAGRARHEGQRDACRRWCAASSRCRARTRSNDDLREYAFKHQILHQVTYETVLKRTRRELHGKLARWLAAQTGLRANDFLGAAAEHYERAGDAANAAEYHTRAAEHARTRMAHEAVLDHVQRALALLNRTSEAGTRLLALASARGARGHAGHSRATGSGSAQTSRRWPSLPRRWTTTGDAPMRPGGAAPWRNGSPTTPRWKPPREQAVEWARRAGDDEIRLLAQRMLAMSLAFQGRPAEGRAVARGGAGRGALAGAAPGRGSRA